MDFDDFDLADAALLGGVFGFVEESTKAEEEGTFEEDTFEVEDDFHDTVAEWVSRTPDVQLRLLYDENPDLVEFMVKKFYQEREQDLKAVETREIQEVRKEMQEELEKLEQDELNTN